MSQAANGGLLLLNDTRLEIARPPMHPESPDAKGALPAMGRNRLHRAGNDALGITPWQSRCPGSDERMTIDRAQEREWIRQNNLANAGLIGAALIIVQPFLNAARLDVTGKICVVSFAV